MPKVKEYYKKLIAQEKPIKFISSRLLWRSGLSRFIIINKKRYRMRFYPSSVSASYWFNPDILKNDEELISAYLKEGDIVVDVGANVGSLTLLSAAIAGETGRVFSIEPHPRVFRYLKGNTELNKFNNIALLNVAAGEKRGNILFSDKKSDDQNEVVKESGITVPVDTLDNLILKEGLDIDFMKIDVEGYEKFVLMGAEGVLERTKVVYFESSARHFSKYNYDFSEIFEIFNKKMFVLYRLAKKTLNKIVMPYTSINKENILAVKDVEDFLKRVNGRYVMGN